MNWAGRVFHRRLRGFRLVDLVAFGCLAVLATGVHLAKAAAGRESARITDVDAQITEERRRVRVLRAEIAHLEQPARLERLSALVGLAPAKAAREAPVEALPDLARTVPFTATPAAQAAR